MEISESGMCSRTLRRTALPRSLRGMDSCVAKTAGKGAAAENSGRVVGGGVHGSCLMSHFVHFV